MKKTALITGASQGIGKAVADLFKEKKIQLIIPDIEEMDLSSVESVDKYLSTIKQPIDMLVNNAGINQIETITDISDANIRNTLEINMIAPIRLIREIIPHMIKNKYGRIVNISSVWSIVSKPGRTIYSISKSGLNALTRSIAVELGPYNILVNAVAPGFVDTELTRKNNTEEQLNILKEKIPLGRLADVEEIAEIVWFLCSDNNRYMTGQVLYVDGGFTCQ